MYDDMMKKIKKLSDIECTLYEVSGAIYTRENIEILNSEIKKFENIIDEQFSSNNVNLEVIKNDKDLLLNKYKDIVQSFLDTVESLYAYIQETIQTTETNQNVIFIKKTTLEYVDNLISDAKTEEEKEEILKAAKVLQVSTDDLKEKIYNVLEKINKYEEIVNLCSKEFEVCRYTRQVEINEFLNKKFDIKLDKNSKIFNKKDVEEKNKKNIIDTFNNFLDELSDKVTELNNNIENYNYNFITNIENFQKEITQT